MTTKKLSERLAAAAAAHLGIPTTEITGKARQTYLVESRWAIWLVMRGYGLTYREISEQFAVTNANVQHGVRRAKAHQGSREKSFRNLLGSIRKAVPQEIYAAANKVHSFFEQHGHVEDRILIERLESAIRLTILENLHLADGETCTLRRLVEAIDFKIPKEKA